MFWHVTAGKIFIKIVLFYYIWLMCTISAKYNKVEQYVDLCGSGTTTQQT